MITFTKYVKLEYPYHSIPYPVLEGYKAQLAESSGSVPNAYIEPRGLNEREGLLALRN